MLDRFETVATDALGGNGRLVKTIGDALMLVFDEPGAAVATAVALFTALNDTDLPVARCGLHHGTAVERNGDHFGAAVNLAAESPDRLPEATSWSRRWSLKLLEQRTCRSPSSAVSSCATSPNR